MSFAVQSKSYPFTESEAPGIVAQVLAGSNGAIVIDPTQPSGEVKYKGVDIAWTIGADEITVTIKGEAFYDPAEPKLWEMLDKLFGGAA